MPASSAAAWMARLSCRALRGRTGFWPGNSHPPPDPQAFEQYRGEHRVAILLSLTLLDAQGHALAVDVADLQVHHLVDAQPRAIGQRQGRLVLEMAGRRNQAADFLGTEDHRQFARQMHRLHLGHQVAAVQRDGEEELQAADGRVQRGRRDAVIDQMQLVIAQILHAGRVRRAPEILREVAHGADVIELRLLAQLPHPHVVDHALAQRTDARLLSFHGLLLSEIEADCLISNIGSYLPLQNHTPLSPTYNGPAPSLPRERFSPSTLCGLMT